MRNLWREPFDAGKTLVTRRPITAGDTSLAPGDVLPDGELSPFPVRRLRQLYDNRTVCHLEAWLAAGYEANGEAAAPVTDPVVPALPPVTDPVVTETFAPLATVLPGVTTDEDGPEDDIEKLREDAKSLNIDVDGRWGAKRLHAEIDKALNDGKSA